MGASAKVILFKSKTFSDGKHPVLLRVTIDRRLKYYNIGGNYKCDEKQWNKKDGIFNKKLPNHEKANKEILKALSKAFDIITDLKENVPNYNLSDFDRKFSAKKDQTLLFDYFDGIIERNQNAGKAGNAEVYKTTKSKFYDFFNKNDNVQLSDVTVKMLNLFIEKAIGEGLKPITIDNYLRTLRALYNKAIKEEGYEYFPFKNFDWSKLKSTTAKRAISKENLLKIINYEAEPGTEEFDTVNMFGFMYLTYGLNFSDLAKMKSTNIIPVGKNQVLEYNRSKGGKLYRIPLNKRAQSILDHYSSHNVDTGYIFPVLHQDIHITPQQIKTRIKTALKGFNENLKTVSKKLGIKEKVTSYVARHTFATVLAKGGENLSTISEMLGHSDLKTTQIYLKELDYSEKIRASEKLL
jgi:integrase/recombinase XerD